MTTRRDLTERQDLHNSSTNFAAAVAGQCGFTHLPSGRTCRLRYRHPGFCVFVSPERGGPPPGAGQKKTDPAMVSRRLSAGSGPWPSTRHQATRHGRRPPETRLTDAVPIASARTSHWTPILITASRFPSRTISKEHR